MDTVKQILSALWRLVRRASSAWLYQTRKRQGLGRVVIIGGTIFLACCLCSIPIAIFAPEATPTPVPRVAETGEGLAGTELAEIEPTSTPIPEPTETSTPMPTETSRPTDTPTAEPTETPTPLPTETTTPTSTPRPTNTPINTPSPTNTPRPTATATPASTPTPRPTPTPAQPTQPAEPTSPPAEPGSPVIIIAVDKRAEYVDLRNVSSGPVDLSGWRLLSERGNQDCALGGAIEAGQVLRVWAMEEDADQGGFNCGHGSNIWNNSELDRAILFNANGDVVSTWP